MVSSPFQALDHPPGLIPVLGLPEGYVAGAVRAEWATAPRGRVAYEGIGSQDKGSDRTLPSYRPGFFCGETDDPVFWWKVVVGAFINISGNGRKGNSLCFKQFPTAL